MNIKIINEPKNKLVFNIQGKSHGFLNLLRKELTKDKHVKAAAYRIEHPLKDSVEMVVETDGEKQPKEVLVDAAKKLKKAAEDLRSSFAKAAK